MDASLKTHDQSEVAFLCFCFCVFRMCTWRFLTCTMMMVTSLTALSAVVVEKFCSVGTPTAAGLNWSSSTSVSSSVTHLPLSSRSASCRCFCVDCLDILVDPGTSNSARYLDPWRCYMCQPLLKYGVLKRRHDWNLKLQEFFANDNGQEFVSHFHTVSYSFVQFFMLESLFATFYIFISVTNNHVTRVHSTVVWT